MPTINPTRSSPSPRLFIGIYPTGIVYADRHVIEDGDYRTLAKLDFSHLRLWIAANVPDELLDVIRADAHPIMHRRGQPYPLSSSGQTITLGYALKTGETMQ